MFRRSFCHFASSIEVANYIARSWIIINEKQLKNIEKSITLYYIPELNQLVLTLLDNRGYKCYGGCTIFFELKEHHFIYNLMKETKGFSKIFDITFYAHGDMGINTQIEARECFDPG